MERGISPRWPAALGPSWTSCTRCHHPEAEDTQRAAGSPRPLCWGQENWGVRPLESQVVSPVGCRHSGLLRKQVGSVCVRTQDSQEPLVLGPATQRVPGALQPAASPSWRRPGALPRGWGSAGLCFPTTSALAGSAFGTSTPLATCSPAVRALERASCPRHCRAVPCTLVPQASQGARQALLPEPEVPTAPPVPRPVPAPPPAQTPGCPAAPPSPLPLPTMSALCSRDPRRPWYITLSPCLQVWALLGMVGVTCQPTSRLSQSSP